MHKAMNYENYEETIVEGFGVALIGWPGDGKVVNPGSLSSHQRRVLKSALEKEDCKWVKLTPAQMEARKLKDAQREQGGERVSGPPRKKRAKTSAPERAEHERVEEDEDEENDLDDDDVNMAC